jgi:Tol biopolymer transport system component
MQLRVIARESGRPRVLYRHEQLNWMQPFAWSPDGRSILAVLDQAGTSELGLISAADGSFRPLVSGRSPNRAEFSPDGRHVVYDHTVARGVPMREISIVDVSGDNERSLVSSPDHDFLLGWFPDGRHVLFGSDRLNTPGAYAIAVADGRPQGAPILLKADIGRTSSLGFDRRGRLYTSLSVAGNDVTIAEVDPATGRMTQQARSAPKSQPLARRNMASWSPDGQKLIYTQSLDGRGTSLVVQTISTGELAVRPTALRNIFRPSWFPDGQSVAIRAQDVDGQQGVFKIDLRTGEQSVLLRPTQNFTFLSPDGEWFGYLRQQTLVRRRIADGAETVLLKAQGGTAVISPDGQSIARFAGTSIVVTSATGGADRVVLQDVSGGRMAFSHDGRHIYYASRNQVWRVPTAGGSPIDTGIRTVATQHLSVSPDGRRIALSGGTNQSEVWLWENVLPQR